MRELRLTGLAGWGSIPLGIACLGGLLTFLGLSALRYCNELPQKRGERKVHMKRTGKTRTYRWFRIKKSVISTIWAIGTGMWSGLALSGQAHVQTDG